LPGERGAGHRTLRRHHDNIHVQPTIAEAVAAGKDLDEVRINDLMCREVVP